MVILGDQLSCPYNHDGAVPEADCPIRYYFDDAGIRLILSDGTLFVTNTIRDEKALFRETIPCTDATHAGVRSWYRTFQQHVMDHGYYVHPFLCFRRDHGGDSGFTIGNGGDDDLPSCMEVPIASSKMIIYRLLNKKDMFPKDSNIPAIISNCYGDGYKALKSIIFPSHPNFHEQPAVLITTYPKQRNYTLLEYETLFCDYLQMRAFISNVDSSLDDEQEKDIFINNVKYGKFLNRVTRDECKQAALAHKYRGSQFVETLAKFLQAPDSPALEDRPRSARSTPRSSPRSSPTNLPPRQTRSMTSKSLKSAFKRINQIATDELSLAGSETSSNLGDIYDDLYELQADDSHDDDVRQLHHLYCAKIYSIKKDNSLASKNPCIICGGTHTFMDCKVLQDTAFLHSHYIRYCQHLRREAAARSSTFSGSEGQLNLPDSSKKVNFIDQLSASDDDKSTASEDSHDSRTDFQTGRR